MISLGKPSNDDDDSGGGNTGFIVGLVLGILAVFILIVIAAWYFKKRNKNSHSLGSIQDMPMKKKLSDVHDFLLTLIKFDSSPTVFNSLLFVLFKFYVKVRSKPGNFVSQHGPLFPGNIVMQEKSYLENVV